MRPRLPVLPRIGNVHRMPLANLETHALLGKNYKGLSYVRPVIGPLNVQHLKARFDAENKRPGLVRCQGKNVVRRIDQQFAAFGHVHHNGPRF